MKKVIVLPGSEVYHERGCRCLNRVRREKRISIEPQKAISEGCRPCKCCSTTRFHFNIERKKLECFITGKDMIYRAIKNAVYVRTSVSCWKLLYDPNNMTYRIYHRNKSDKPVNFRHMELESYHLQRDKRDAESLFGCFQYIYSHDTFRRVEQEAGGRLNMVNISPKYRQKIVERKHRQERRRLRSIFAAIEQKHPEYIELAYC